MRVVHTQKVVMDPQVSAPMNARLRASDRDREHAIEQLTGHTAAGRLSLDEFAARADAVNRSKTFGELAAVTADLPMDRAAAPWVAAHRPAALAMALTAVVLAMLLVVGLLAASTGWVT
jgi:Domain of unknown function (DUF1707)